mmetsp:Transcript_16474/g.24301  ORF Transcript_16474/g.24301 Transcript_16474/m.24301 type:complete len:98 (+) Transcript_16474:115-408(+)
MPHRMILSNKHMEIAMDEYQKCVETRQRGGTITLSQQRRYADAATPELLRQLNNAVVAYRTNQNNKRARIEVTNNNNNSSSSSNRRPPAVKDTVMWR